MPASPEFREEYVPIDVFREEDYDKSSRRIRDPLKTRNRTIFKKDLAVFANNTAAKEAGLIKDQLYLDNEGVPRIVT